MIHCITGKLIYIDPSYAVVEAGGVGYRCSTSTTTLAKLPSRGDTVTLFTYLYIREDNIELFGFADEEELRCFRLLISVSSVGPKVALAILCENPPSRLLLAIASGDVKALTRASGVGPKVAQRVILELKDKVGAVDAAAGFVASAVSDASAPSAQGEAISALISLGYAQSDAAAVIAKLDPALPVDALVREALRKIARGM